MAKEAIPGGITEQVAAAGGQDLFIEMAMTMAGKDIGSCVYALTRCLANVGLFLSDDLGHSSKMLRQVGEDAVNELELNWPERKALLTKARANTHLVGGSA